MVSIEANATPVGKKPIHVEPGEYEVICTGYRIQSYRGKPKLVLEFQLQRGPFVNGEAMWDAKERHDAFVPRDGYDHPNGVTLSRYYNVLRVNDDGTVAVGWKTDLAQEYAIAANERVNNPTRLDPDVFTGGLFRARVESVTTRRGNAPIHPTMQYSKIDLLLSRVDG